MRLVQKKTRTTQRNEFPPPRPGPLHDLFRNAAGAIQGAVPLAGDVAAKVAGHEEDSKPAARKEDDSAKKVEPPKPAPAPVKVEP